MKCPLCHSDNTSFFIHAENRDYWHCDVCELVFVPENYFLSRHEELKRYNLHENHIEDVNYRNFLSQALNPIVDRVAKGKSGLDYGSGPSPVLATLLEIEGYKMKFYDPYFANDTAVFAKTYDFITLTEVAEHFYSPKVEFEKLFSLLKPNAFLLVMTNRTESITKFENWHYQKDQTHVMFYHKKSFEYLAKHYKSSIEFIDNRIVIFNKK